MGSYSFTTVSGVLMKSGNKTEIGRSVRISDFAHTDGAGDVGIGEDTLTVACLSIYSGNHNFDDRSRPIGLQVVSWQGISVGRNSWTGAKSAFLNGSAIGDGCVGAAGALVNQVFLGHAIIGRVTVRIFKLLDRGAA